MRDIRRFDGAGVPSNQRNKILAAHNNLYGDFRGSICVEQQKRAFAYVVPADASEGRSHT
jgi:hypothetical protein